VLTLETVRLGWLLAASVVVAAACGGPVPAPSMPAAPSTATSTTATAQPAASPTIPRSPGPAATAPAIDIDDLPLVTPDPATLTAVCDPSPNQLDPNAGETTLFCFDSVVLGLRAMRLATSAPVRRAYLVRTGCPPVPCASDGLDTGTLVAFTGGATFAVLLDSRVATVPPPIPVSGNPWPTVGLFTSPPIGRENVLPAPPTVASRTPLPSCGRATLADPDQGLACFRSSILLGKPAEVIRESPATDGGVVIEVVRFGGTGAITRYQRTDGRWVEQVGGIVLGPTEQTWDFDAWDGGVVLQ
jgi:hypothetical protein